jgi:hypothetical protein
LSPFGFCVTAGFISPLLLGDTITFRPLLVPTMGFFGGKKNQPRQARTVSYAATNEISLSTLRITNNTGNPASSTNAHDEYSMMESSVDNTVRTSETIGSKETSFSITRDGQYLTLNGFANGHLMRWKFAAEEGPTIIRLPALLLAFGCVVTSFWPLITMPAYWHVPNLISAFHTCVLCSLIIVLEGRVLMYRSPMNTRARVRGIATRYLNILRLVWGRGLLYIFAGSMNLTINFFYVIYTGLPLCIIGLLAVGTGAHASYNMNKIRASLTDEAYLWGKFDVNDADNDGLLDVNGFAELLWDLGLEFDDVYTYKAFQQIDKDSDSKVSFEEFKGWWIVTQNDGQKLQNKAMI